MDSCSDRWNVWNWSIYCEIWIWILQKLRYISCKSKNFVLAVKPTLISLFWLFGLCLFGWLFGMYDSQNWVGYVVIAVWKNILNFALSTLCLVYIKFLMPSVIELGCKRYIGWKQKAEILLSSVKMSCLRCFCSAMKLLMPSVVKLGCKRCIG